ncbi:Phenylalanyl-tRNA synthetase [Intoshia linei]|uniref:phenylalanine--tRNA ligase n=1 Tax=Intoshia linei TaxID=1819745 RepID=A0A177B912_9BILA|nr:Phenylalanyl-tRNA synthetase [Intoshia linei]
MEMYDECTFWQLWWCLFMGMLDAAINNSWTLCKESMDSDISNIKFRHRIAINYLEKHTTIHDIGLLKLGLDSIITVGNCFRRDTIDKHHFPVFTQLDVIHSQNKFQVAQNLNKSEPIEIVNEKANFENAVDNNKYYTERALHLVEKEMKQNLESLIQSILGLEFKIRWVDAFFPFTEPSWEMEILPPNMKDEEKNWIELLGCGIFKNSLLARAGVPSSIALAFGIGLDRLAMLKYSVPDIRMLWSTEERFYKQFQVENATFKPLSIQPLLINDISFWLDASTQFHNHDFYDMLRDIANDVVEDVRLIDTFHQNKQDSNLTSRCYRISYRHYQKPLSNNEVAVFNDRLKSELKKRFNAIIR